MSHKQERAVSLIAHLRLIEKSLREVQRDTARALGLIGELRRDDGLPPGWENNIVEIIKGLNPQGILAHHRIVSVMITELESEVDSGQERREAADDSVRDHGQSR